MHLGRKNKLVKLLENTPEKWYWLGFLLADGCFLANGRLKVCISSRDKEHLDKFRNFVDVGNVKPYNEYLQWQVMDVSTCTNLMCQFNIRNRKTYEPPDLSVLTEEQMFCLSIGFIDGDGTISKQSGRQGSYISIKVHSSWLDTLQIMFPWHKPYIQNSGYAVINISDTKSVRAYKNRAKELSLPFLDRKWENIDSDFISRQEASDKKKPLITKMLSEGLSQQEIASRLNLSKSNLSQLIKRNNLKGVY